MRTIHDSPERAKPNDKWFRIIGVPLFVLPFVYYYVNKYGFSWALVLLTFFWGVTSTVATWELLRWWVFRARARYMQIDRTGWRVLLTFIGYALLIAILQPIETWSLSQIDPTGLIATPTRQTYLTHIAMAISFAFIVGGIYEVIYYLKLYRLAITDAEALKKAKMQTELDALRQQVNPHFLFNSLNSLTALISEDPQKAELFSEELSTVYRYLLRSNETPLVPLASELDFINSYYHLLKTRHGDALTLITAIQPGLETRQLPPLTLQLLIENAVKHNIILPEQPLIISLTTDAQQQLIVSNNLQRKLTRALSNGVGLSNILSKYQMLGQPTPTIEDDGHEFRVTLPLV
ncbi:sensor histidine kinase [Spirosoma profusum]|uniref:sensor histidine kinase n=1 Tax=Spirosoma profusum TaxID=2771354 RepID=UPI00293B94BB|nr:histidine kinase [Spirosoma profusum]